MPSARLATPLTKEDKPWLATRPPRTRLSYAITLLCIIAGLGGAALLCYTGVRGVPLLDPNSLCLVLDEEFDSSTLDTSTWTRDVELGGFGNGEFQMTTTSDDNLYIQDGELYLMPTLTPDSILSSSNYTLPGCTATLANGQTNSSACSVKVSGSTVVNPVMSARINTMGKKTIKFGKVEVRAKMPTGYVPPPNLLHARTEVLWSGIGCGRQFGCSRRTASTARGRSPVRLISSKRGGTWRRTALRVITMSGRHSTMGRFPVL